MAKLVTDALLKKSIEDVLTELVNNTFDWQEYTDEEVGQLVELDPTQVAELSAVINDSVAATNKVYSSQHTKELLQENLIEANKYTDDLVANLSNIKLDIVDSLPDSSTVDKSTIYILKDSSGGTDNTLNVWSDTTSAFIEVGKLNVSMNNYYTKSEVDTELVKKANADEVLKPDAIVADLTTTSGSTTLSTAGLQTELDKKFDKSGILSAVSVTPSDNNVLSEKATKAELDKKIDKTSIATSISSSSTDEQVVSAKAVNELNLRGTLINQSVVDKYGTEIIKYPCGRWYFASSNVARQFSDIPWNEACIIDITSIQPNTNPWDHTWAYRNYMAQTIAGKGTYIRQLESRATAGTLGYDSGWRRVTNTSVSDVPKTAISSSNSDITLGSNSCYSVVNGICYVTIWEFKGLTVSRDVAVVTGMPKPKQITGTSIINANGSGDNVAFIYVDNSNSLCVNTFTTNVYGYGSFSYPVAES